MGNRRKNKQQKNQNAEQLEKKNVEHTDNTIESFEFPPEKNTHKCWNIVYTYQGISCKNRQGSLLRNRKIIRFIRNNKRSTSTME